LRTYINTKPKRGFVYVLLDQQGRRKLGKTVNDVEKRVKQLQTGNAEQITIEYRLEVNDMRRAENAIHDLFAASRLRINGEWFKLSESELILLQKVFKAAGTTAREERLLEGLGLR
jgi:predicted GIY-YIG superfamily endonuclease